MKSLSLKLNHPPFSEAAEVIPNINKTGNHHIKRKALATKLAKESKLV